VSIERFQTNPKRHRASVVTTSPTDFAKYVKEFKTDETRIFFDRNKKQAIAIIDYGDATTAGWGQHTIKLELLLHEMFDHALGLSNQKQINQDPLVEFIMDWPEYLTFYADCPMADGFADEKRDAIPIQKAVTAIRNVKVKNNKTSVSITADNGHNRSAMELVEIEANGIDKLPAAIVVHSPVFQFTDAQSFAIRITSTSDVDGDPVFRLRIIGLDQLYAETIRAIGVEIADTVDAPITYGAAIINQPTN
jgi:uncharacterized protein YfdQ (DUF2303 family)